MKLPVKIIMYLIIIYLSNCKILKNSNSSTIVFEFQTTSCYGTCPVYTMQIFSDGTLTLDGFEHLDKIGHFKSRISIDKLNELILSFDNASFFNLENSYRSQFKDLPTKYITYSKNGNVKKIMAYDNIPKDLKALIKSLEILVSELNWEKAD